MQYYEENNGNIIILIWQYQPCLTVNNSSVHVIPEKQIFVLIIFNENILTFFASEMTFLSGWLHKSLLLSPPPL